MTSGKSQLAIVVALAYTLVIVYASLHPFAGWRTPPQDILFFLSAPWPRYITAGDVTLNLVAYLPLGAALLACLRQLLPPAAAVFFATLLSALLSLAVESVQMFLPMRIASNVDLLCNSIGAAAGALAACLVSLPTGNPLAVLRQRTLRADALGDCGLIVVALWIVIQFHPTPLALGSGDWRELLRITPFFPHAPLAYLLAESGVVAFAVTAIGLLVSLLLQPQRLALPAIALTLLLALAAKSAASVMLARVTHWLQWLTPGVLLGIAAGVVLLALLLRLSRRSHAALAVLCILCGALLLNVTPENPYYSIPNFMLSPQTTHLVNFNHIVHTLSLFWPLLAIAYLAWLAKADRVAPR